MKIVKYIIILPIAFVLGMLPTWVIGYGQDAKFLGWLNVMLFILVLTFIFEKPKDY